MKEKPGRIDEHEFDNADRQSRVKDEATKKQKRRDKRDRAKAAAKKGGKDEPEKETPRPRTESAKTRHLVVKDAIISSLTTATALSVEDAEKIAE